MPCADQFVMLLVSLEVVFCLEGAIVCVVVLSSSFRGNFK